MSDFIGCESRTKIDLENNDLIGQIKRAVKTFNCSADAKMVTMGKAIYLDFIDVFWSPTNEPIGEIKLMGAKVKLYPSLADDEICIYNNDYVYPERWLSSE